MEPTRSPLPYLSIFDLSMALVIILSSIIITTPKPPQLSNPSPPTSSWKTYMNSDQGFSFNYPADFSFREYRQTNTDRYDNSTQIIYGFLEKGNLKEVSLPIEVKVNSRLTINNTGEYNQYLPQNLINSADYFFYCSAPMGTWTCNAQSTIKFPNDANRLLYLNCNNRGKENFCHLIMPQILSTVKFSSVTSSSKTCNQDADCILLECSGCFNKNWVETAPPDLPCMVYSGYSCTCINNICAETK